MAGTDVATAKKGQAIVAFDYGDDAGAGFENQTADDYSIPFLAVLQQMSPQCGDERDGGLVGAKPGMLLNSVTGELWDGREGVEFVPATTQHVFVEWVPREKGGGIVGRHEVDSDVVRRAKGRNTEFGKMRTDSGNDLVETFYVYGVLCPNGQPGENIVIAFTSTKIKVYKQFNTRVGMFMVPNGKGGKQRVPLFANVAKITTTKQKNNKGDFYNFVINPANGDVASSLMGPSDPRYLAAKQCKTMVDTGVAKADYASQESAGRDSDVSGDRAPF